MLNEASLMHTESEVRKSQSRQQTTVAFTMWVADLLCIVVPRLQSCKRQTNSRIFVEALAGSTGLQLQPNWQHVLKTDEAFRA